eukprot:3720492-Rhodomonas_salina.1
MDLTVERVTSTELQAFFSISFEEVGLERICTQWQAHLWLDLQMVSTIHICDCNVSRPGNTALCQSRVQPQLMQKTVFHMEVFLRPLDVEGCVSSGRWVRAHKEIDLGQMQCAQSQYSTISFDDGAGEREFDWICDHLPPLQAFSKAPRPVHELPVL